MTERLTTKSEGLLFWTLRDQLWPPNQRAAPFARVYSDNVDLELQKTLNSSGINTATFTAQGGCRGLAASPTLQPMEPILGDAYAPYREVRHFWIPFAASAAAFYKRAEQRQPTVKPMIDVLIAIREQLKSARQQGDNTLHKSWDGSPFRTLAPDPIDLLNEVEKVFDRFSAVTEREYEDINAARTNLEIRLKDYSKKKRKTNIDVYSTTFIDILSIAFFRFSKRLPSGSQDFRDFVAGAWELVHQQQMGTKGDRTFRKLADRQPILSDRINDVGSVLEFTESLWHDIIYHGPMNSQKKRSMQEAIYSAYMLSPRIPFWPDLDQSGAPTKQK